MIAPQKQMKKQGPAKLQLGGVRSGQRLPVEEQVAGSELKVYSETTGGVASQCAYAWLNGFFNSIYKSASQEHGRIKSEEGRGEQQLSQHGCDRWLAAFP